MAYYGAPYGGNVSSFKAGNSSFYGGIEVRCRGPKMAARTRVALTRALRAMSIVVAILWSSTLFR